MSCGPAPPRPTSADETFYVLEGELTLFVAGEQIVLGPGQAALAPRGVPHAYRVESEGPAGW
jgi:quercetin dioxygenase-like cupin family protein